MGETIHIRDFPYTVVGVMEFKEQDSSYDGRDVTKIFVPFSAMIRDFPNKPPAEPHTIDQMLAQPKSVDGARGVPRADRANARPYPQFRSSRQRSRARLGHGGRPATISRHDERDEVFPWRSGRGYASSLAASAS